MAGHFYPGDPTELIGLVDGLLATALASRRDGAPGGETVGAAIPGEAVAYVVPHAGYAYSGPTAARAYAHLRRCAGRVRRVVLIGPSHRVRLTGIAVPSAAAWATPLGEVPVDAAGARELAAAGLAAVDDAPHAREHSLEVQLPFLQRVLPAPVPILPLAVGVAAPPDVAAALTATVTDATVLLCSTDLSHYQPDAAARRQDARTARAILDRAPERIGPADACGRHALRGLLRWAADRDLRPELLHRCTSAETAGDPARVVGYAAFAMATAIR